MDDDFKKLIFPAVLKTDGFFEVYDGSKCYTTDKAGALKRVSQLMKSGRIINYYKDYRQVSPLGFFTDSRF